MEIIKIAKAIFNWFFDRHAYMANKRLDVCNKCELIDRSGKKCVLPGTQPCCGVCGCSLSLLTRSVDSECPHPKGNKWSNVKV